MRINESINVFICVFFRRVSWVGNQKKPIFTLSSLDCAVWVGGAYALSPVNHSSTSQSSAFVSLSMCLFRLKCNSLRYSLRHGQSAKRTWCLLRTASFPFLGNTVCFLLSCFWICCCIFGSLFPPTSQLTSIVQHLPTREGEDCVSSRDTREVSKLYLFVELLVMQHHSAA